MCVCVFSQKLISQENIVLPGYLEMFLTFWESEIFCQDSVYILWESFHM